MGITAADGSDGMNGMDGMTDKSVDFVIPNACPIMPN